MGSLIRSEPLCVKMCASYRAAPVGCLDIAQNIIAESEKLTIMNLINTRYSVHVIVHDIHSTGLWCYTWAFSSLPKMEMLFLTCAQDFEVIHAFTKEGPRVRVQYHLFLKCKIWAVKATFFAVTKRYPFEFRTPLL